MIHVTIDSNEAMRPRADLIRKAIETDYRFCLSNGRLGTPFDIRFDKEDLEMSQEEEMRSLKLVLVQSTTGGNR